MSKILFFPLNTNHVHIFKNIVQFLKNEYLFLSHDNISDSAAYHTAQLMEDLNLRYIHFRQRINRSTADNIIKRILIFFKIRKAIRDILVETAPKVVVFGIDNDPIAQIFVNESRKRSIKTLLIQEALVRPFEYTMRPTYLSDYFYKFMRSIGMYLNYIQYGTSGCDKILVGGERAKSIYINRGIPEEKCVLVGQPKFDSTIIKIRNMTLDENGSNKYLFAASTKVIKDHDNINFLKTLVQVIDQNRLKLIIKLHPRTAASIEEIEKKLDIQDSSSCELVKEGDDTFELLKRSDVFITVSSTVILDALLLNKECIVVDYLAGESKLNYNSYDAVFTIERKSEIENVIMESMKEKKNKENKDRLLGDELYKLDGRSGERVAQFVDNIIEENS